MPFVDGDLAGEDGGATPITVLEDLVEVTTGAGVERFEAPIVEDEELDAGEAAQDAGVAAVTADSRATSSGIRIPREGSGLNVAIGGDASGSRTGS